MRERLEWRISKTALLITVSMFLVISGLVESKHFRASRPNPIRIGRTKR